MTPNTNHGFPTRNPPRMKDPKPATAPRAFTLLELLVAMAISLILLAVLFNATLTVMSGYERTGSSVLRQGDISLALDQVVQDLEGMVIPNIPNAEALRSTPDPIAALDGQGGDGPAVPPPHWLALLSTVTDSDNSLLPGDGEDAESPFGGATRAVSYRVDYKNPVDGSPDRNPVYSLYRSVASARHTFANAVGLTDLQNSYWSNVPENGEEVSRTTDLNNFLAGNVVRFHVRFQYRDPASQGSAEPRFLWTEPSQNIRIGRNGATINGVPVAGGFVRAEVLLTVITEEGMNRLADGVMDLNEVIERYGRTSVRQTAFFEHE